MKRITLREKKLLWGACLAAFLLFNCLLVWSWIGSAIERQGVLGRLRAECQLQKETIAKTGTWESEIRSLKTAVQTAEEKNQDTDWLRRLELIAKKSGLNMTSQRPMNEKKMAYGTESGVNYSIESNQEALVKFLFSLQNDPANPQVQILQITPDAANSDKLRVETTITVTRFSL
jgi:hypothetical protein